MVKNRYLRFLSGMWRHTIGQEKQGEVSEEHRRDVIGKR